MVFVPAGVARLPFELGDSATFGSDSNLLVDRFEVTRAGWARWTDQQPAPRGLRSALATSLPERSTWPAFASFDEAVEVAAMRGMRLPTAREWLWLAAGTRALPYPWGVLPRVSVANTLELDLRRPVAVGTFEQGQSSFGCYDLIGNVAEWVVLDGSIQIAGGDLGVVSGCAAVGGSFLGRLQPLFGSDPTSGAVGSVLRGEVLPPATRSVDIGFRCVVEAEAFLAEHADDWADAVEARSRLERLGRRWGSAAVPQLEALARGVGDDHPLQWILNGARR